MKTKKCTQCKKIKNIRQFYKTKRGLQSACKMCSLEAADKWQKSHKEEHNKSSKKWRINNPKTYILARLKQSARLRNIYFKLYESDLGDLPKFCPVLGIKLNYSGTRHSANSASVDRIDNTKGYIPGNIIIVSHRVNHLKNDATWQELLQIVKFYKKLGKK